MKKVFCPGCQILVICIVILSVYFTGCKKTEDSIKFPHGVFPDSVLNLEAINSVFDDYNVSGSFLYGYMPIIFSSNRKSSGGQFDLVQAIISFSWNQTEGGFSLTNEVTQDPFLNNLINKAETPGNDFGPYRLFSTVDGLEYTFITSENSQGNLDMYYLKNQSVFGSNLPSIEGPLPVNLLNASYDEAYFCFDANQDSAYFISNQDGNFDIFLKNKPLEKDISSWLDLDYSASAKVDSINSPYDDKCPMVFHKVLVFTSDRPGGLGGFDLYYSVFKNGNWSSPVNFGPAVNTSSNEYRPFIGYHPDFTNVFMIFSSDRPGGKGGYDLYFKGIDLPK